MEKEIQGGESIWKVSIEKVGNGYILIDYSSGVETKLVFSDSVELDYREASLESFKELVFQLQEIFAITYSKHNKFNLKVSIETNEDAS